MRFAYYGKRSEISDDTEGHIFKALVELGHDVEMVNMGDSCEADYILFHKNLPKGTGKRVCWYFDKVYTERRENYIQQILKYADYLFLTDETWAIAHPHPKIHILRQGAGLVHKGKKLDTTAKIAFTGSLYNGRFDWATQLSWKYGADFQIFTNTFNGDFNNLCASVPIFVAPPEPSDDHYWSSRVYLTLGAGGFIIHPRCSELEKEYQEGKEIVFYDNMENLYQKIDFYLQYPEQREKIRLAGWEKTKQNYTYKHRVCSLVATLQGK